MLATNEERPAMAAPREPTSVVPAGDTIAHDEWPADAPRRTREDLLAEVALQPAYTEASRRDKLVLEKFIVSDSFDPNTRSFKRMSRPEMARVLRENEKTLAFALARLKKLGLLMYIPFRRDGGSGAFRDGLNHGFIKAAPEWRLASSRRAQPLLHNRWRSPLHNRCAQPLLHNRSRARARLLYLLLASTVRALPLKGFLLG
jgi:hypothetical protein